MAALDAQLHVLEDGCERGEDTVSAHLKRLLGPGLHGIEVGTPIIEALEIVFQEQESLLARRSGSLSRNAGSDKRGADPKVPSRGSHSTVTEHAANGTSKRPDESNTPLDVPGAEILTQRIKTEVNQVFLLLAEAHDRRAWAALGYASWDQYVRLEFGYSRSRSYEFLDQARVIQAIQAATGAATIPDLSAFAARQIKPYLHEVISEIRDRIKTDAPDDISNRIINEVVARKRALSRTKSDAPVWQGPLDQPSPGTTDLQQASHRSRAAISAIDHRKLFAAVDYLAGLPLPSDDLVEAAGIEPDPIGSLRRAIGWLMSLVGRLEAQVGGTQSAASN
jgi:hypothetical protein